MINEQFVAAFDCGNSRTKSIITSESGTTFKGINQTVISLLFKLPIFENENLDSAVADLADNLIVNISSEAIAQSGKYAFGTSVDNVKGIIRNLNINVNYKHSDDIPVIATLATLASTAVQNEYAKARELPSNIELDVKYSTALPFREYSKENARKLAERYTNNHHVVDVYLTEKDIVHVTIKFSEAKVTQEGNPAVFVLIETKDEYFFEEFNQKYGKDHKYTNKDFKDMKILHVDIGDGTIEYIYTANGVPVSNLCRGEKRGVGHAAENAQELFLETIKQNLELNRQQFMKYVLDDSSKFNQDAKFAMKQADMMQSQFILEDIQNIYSNVLRGDVNLITVSGGGACEFKEYLKEPLTVFADASDVKVFWFPDEIASEVNVRGLDILNKKLFFRKK